MNKLINSDKIELVNENQNATDSKLYYIPHFATMQSKRRNIYNGSADSYDTSLNSSLYASRDNMQLLSDILMRFRRYST